MTQSMPLDQGPTTVPDASAVTNQQKILSSFVTNVSKMDPQGVHIVQYAESQKTMWKKHAKTKWSIGQGAPHGRNPKADQKVQVEQKTQNQGQHHLETEIRTSSKKDQKEDVLEQDSATE